MTITITENDKLTIGEILFMIAVINNISLEDTKKSLIDKGFLSKSYNEDNNTGYFIPNEGKLVLNEVLLDADKKVGVQYVKDRIDNLVPLLQDCYPKGKNNSNQYWRGNKTDLKRRLQIFFKKYGDEYSDEQILKACKQYVQSFNGEYKFMRLLQYFIWKEEIKDGSRVPVSDLANYIENEGQENLSNNNWTSTLN